MRRGAGSQWIVAARPLCHLQCPVAYLSRLQRIQPADRLEFRYKGAPRLFRREGRVLRHVPMGALTRPYCGSGGSRRAQAPLL